MKKRYVKAMLFGALVLTVSSHLASCSDYDDDINNLQTQVDAIKGTNPVSASDMQTAISAAKSELQSKIDALQKQLEGNTDDSAIKKIQEDIAKLKEESAKLTDIQNRLTELESAEKEFAATGSLEAYEKKAGLKVYINQQITNALAEEGAITKYIQEAVKAGTLMDLNRVNAEIAKITGPNGSLTELQTKFETYLNGNAEQKGLLARVSDLEAYSSAIEKFIADGKGEYSNFADVLKQIEETRVYLASIATPGGDAYNAIKNVIENELKDADSTIGQLETRIEKLGLDIEAIKAMIQSVVYVPSTLDKQVKFTTLYAKPNVTGASYQLLTSSQDVKAKFRVSPISAAKSFKDKYEVSVYSDKLTRAGEAFSIASIDKVDEETGIVTLTLKANEALVDNYGVCLRVTSKKDSNSKTDVATDLTSDYFTIAMQTMYMDNVRYFSGIADEDLELVYNDQNAALDFKKNGYYEIKASQTESGTKEWMALTNLGVDNSLFHVTLTSSNKDYFTFDGTTLKVKNVGASSSVNKKTTIKNVVTISGVSGNYTTTETDQEVTIVRSQGDAPTISITKEWNGAKAQSYTLTQEEMNKIYDYAGLSQEEFNKLTADKFDFANDDKDVRFALDNNTNKNLKLVIDAYSDGGEAIAKIKVTDTKTITVKANIKIEYMEADEVALVKSASWNGNNVDLPADFISSTKTVYVGFKNLPSLFTNFAAIEAKVKAVGGTIEFSANPEGYRDANSQYHTIAKVTGATQGAATTYELYAPAYLGYYQFTTPQALTLSAKVMFGSHQVGETYTATLQLPSKLSGTITVPTVVKDKNGVETDQRKVTIADRKKAQSLTDQFSWKDYNGKEMWPTVDKETFAGKTSAQVLNMYGLTPVFSFAAGQSNEDTKLFTLNALAGTIQLKPEYANLESFGRDVTVKVVVKALTPWGTIANQETTMEVTLKKWAKPSTQN